MRRTLLPLLAAPLTLGAQPAPLPDYAAAADRVFAPWNSTHTPGCAVGISQGGEVRFTRGYGMADLAGGRPITPATILESGSVAKQFTATAILLLAQDGALTLEDEVQRFIPELPRYGRPLTIRHLLTHTSGLREWSNLVAWQGWPRGTRVHDHPYVLDLITRQRQLNYPVGDFYSYTNSGYLLLRTVVERASGLPFAAFTERRIFAPLGMRDTRWRDDHTRLVPGLAQAYRPVPGGWALDMPWDNIVGAGGLLTTVGDWLRWNDALTRRALGSVSDSLVRPMRLTSGRTIHYALGLMLDRYRGLREVAHSGSTAGYSTNLARYPEAGDLSIAVLCNAAGAPGVQYTRALVDALVPGLPRAESPAAGRAAPARLAALRGLYRDTRTSALVRLDTAGGALRRLPGAPLSPLADGGFLLGTTRVAFDTVAGGAPVAMRQATDDGDTLTYQYMTAAPWTPTTAQLAALAGRYRSDELDVTLTVTVADGRLAVSTRAGMQDALTPAWTDAFTANGETVWFTRDRAGRATALHVGSSRAWQMTFTRLAPREEPR
ncbi:MAG: beta-lactamase family protein [Gemmatimonadetes bacterium]|nr:beta-lactamase family protein [Gemmatimonadota bacterium]